MTGPVTVEYKFYLEAGRANSSCGSLAQQAHDKGHDFFGDRKFQVSVEVTGRGNDYRAECYARAEVEIDGS